MLLFSPLVRTNHSQSFVVTISATLKVFLQDVIAVICICVSDSVFYEVTVLKDYNCISTKYIQ